MYNLILPELINSVDPIESLLRDSELLDDYIEADINQWKESQCQEWGAF